MKIVVNTEVLKGMIVKAVKGAGNNKLIPITQLMGIMVCDNKLRVVTTDATNYLYITNEVECDDFSVTVYADQFAKLVSKITSEYITLEVKDATLEVTGNGSYTIELPLDETGNPIKYPDPFSEIDDTSVEHQTKTNLSLIKSILESLKGSLATTMEMPVITQYYTGDVILATNRHTVAEIDSRFCDINMLISAECMELLNNMTSEVIDILVGDNYVIFKSPDCIVFTKHNMSIEEYPVSTLNALLETEFPSVCNINKLELLSLLDRMTLFASDVTRQLAPVKLMFGDKGLTVFNQSGKSNEFIPYAKDCETTQHDFECWVNIALLTSQLKAYAGDVVEIHYGMDNLIKFVDGSITQVMALFIV